MDVSYLSCETKDFPIAQEYWEYILDHISKDGFVDGFKVSRSDTGFASIKGFSNIRITPIGIEYLQENSMMEKAKSFLSTVSDIL